MRRQARRAGGDARRLLYQYEAAAYELAHANVHGERPGRPNIIETASACRTCLISARTGIDDLARVLLSN